MARHAKITNLVMGLADDGNINLRHNYRQQHEPPFSPLHCAASQGMVAAGRMVLAGCNSSWNQQVRRWSSSLATCCHAIGIFEVDPTSYLYK